MSKKFYKILSSDLKMRGFQYKEGLNEDINELEENIDCGKGLHFTDIDHIFNYLNYGTLIADVTLPKNEKIIAIKYPGQAPDKYKAHRIILSNIRPLNTETIIEIIDEKKKNVFSKNKDLGKHISYAPFSDDAWLYLLGYYPFLSDAKAMEAFITRGNANIHVEGDILLLWAVSNECIDTVKCLLKYGIDIHAYSNDALRLAILRNNFKLVECLVENGIKIKRKFIRIAKRQAKKKKNNIIYEYLLESSQNKRKAREKK